MHLIFYSLFFPLDFDLKVYTCNVFMSGFTCISDMFYLEAQALLLGFLGFGGAGGGAVQGTAAASCRTELAAFPEHLHLGLSALWGENRLI